MDMMFDDSWKIVAVDGIVAVLGAGGPRMTSLRWAAFRLSPFRRQWLLCHSEDCAKANIAEGASFYVKHAIIGTASFEQDSLDVSEAIVTVEAPKGPTIMGDGRRWAGIWFRFPPDGSAQVHRIADNLPDDASISWAITVQTSGDGSLSVLDMEGMMLELDDMMMVTADEIVLKVTAEACR